MLAESDLQTIKGSKVLFQTLKNLGVDTIFGYPGGIVLDIYNELFNQSDIKHVLVRHEQSAVHAAEGYARATGKCGVVLVTSGPGATNTVSGIMNAYLDGYPLVVITGQVFKSLLGKNAFQEANICDITKSCTKKTFQITSVAEIPSVLKNAFLIASSGKKGPVVVDIVKDVFSQISTGVDLVSAVEVETQPFFSRQSLGSIITRLLSASKPVVVSGGGVIHSKAEDELVKFLKTLDIPVVETMMGLGAYSKRDENYFGMIGIFGDKAANEILRKSDLILSLGARFNDRITCMFKDVDLASKFIQVDINVSEISKFINASDYLVADIKDVLSGLNSLCQNSVRPFSSWLKDAQSLKLLNVIRKRQTNLLHSFEVIQKLEEFTKNKNVIFTSEVGQHQLWAVQNLTFGKNRRIFVSGGTGTMGFGFPAAIGAAIAKPESNIVCVAGDGSFQMAIHELATCKDYDLNLKIILLNNGYLGMVRQLQEKFCNGRYSQTKISNPDYITLAKSYGIEAQRVSQLEDVIPALEKAFSHNSPSLIEFIVEPMEVL
jgi:acetolactate synthase-1/2/3 large subunit